MKKRDTPPSARPCHRRVGKFLVAQLNPGVGNHSVADVRAPHREHQHGTRRAQLALPIHPVDKAEGQHRQQRARERHPHPLLAKLHQGILRQRPIHPQDGRDLVPRLHRPPPVAGGDVLVQMLNHGLDAQAGQLVRVVGLIDHREGLHAGIGRQLPVQDPLGVVFKVELVQPA